MTLEVLMVIFGLLVGFVMVYLPLVVVPPIARWLSVLAGRITMWLRPVRQVNTVVPILELAGLVIEPGSGVGPLCFGMRPSRVLELLGPSLGWDAWDDGNLNDSLIYDGMRLYFDSCDSHGPLPKSRLCIIELRRSDGVLFGRSLAEWSENELVAELQRRWGRPQVLETGYAEFFQPYTRVFFEGGRLSSVEVAA